MLEKSEWKRKDKMEGKKNNPGKLAHTNLNPWEDFKNPPTIPPPSPLRQGQNTPTRADSQTHKPQFTFNLCSAELQS